MYTTYAMLHKFLAYEVRKLACTFDPPELVRADADSSCKPRDFPEILLEGIPEHMDEGRRDKTWQGCSGVD